MNAEASATAKRQRLSDNALPSALVDEAIAWTVKLDFSTCDASTRVAFDAWLQEDPRHALAWQRVQSLRKDLFAVPSRLALDTLQATQARRTGGGVQRRQALKLLSLAGTVGLGAWAVQRQAPWQRLIADASTGVGERHTLALGDGVVVMLNTDSAVNTATHDETIDGLRRRVELLRGEIFVNAGEGLRVQTGFGELTARQSRFVLRRHESGARLTVQQGAVAMHAAPGEQPVMARASESWLLSGAGPIPAAAQDFVADAWTDGVLEARRMRLADLLAELSRYRKGRIACDERVADLRVSGIYQLGDTDRTLQFIAQTQHVQLRYWTRFWASVGPAQA